MILSEEIIEKILFDLSKLLDNQFIITGSIADFFHIGYKDIHDVDIFLKDIDFISNKNNLSLNNDISYVSSLIGIKTKKGTALHKYKYKNLYDIDITTVDQSYGWIFGRIKKPFLEDGDITIVSMKEKKYKIFSPMVRINQLSKNNYTKKHPNYELKVEKAIKRAKIYEEKYGIVAT